MRMKRQSFHLLLVFMAIIACKNTPQESVGQTAITEAPKAVQPIYECFMLQEGRQTTAIQMITTGSDISGFFAWEYPDNPADQYYGHFTGQLTGEQVIADFVFQQSGKVKKEEIMFNKKPGSLLQGRAELHAVGDQMKIKDKTSVIWSLMYQGVDCNRVRAQIDKAKALKF
jgi:hypothetical protein